MEEALEGKTLTIAAEIVRESGLIIANKGDKVTVTKAHYSEGHWHRRIPDIYVHPKLLYVSLAEHSGHWLPHSFEELKHLKL